MRAQLCARHQETREVMARNTPYLAVADVMLDAAPNRHAFPREGNLTHILAHHLGRACPWIFPSILYRKKFATVLVREICDDHVRELEGRARPLQDRCIEMAASPDFELVLRGIHKPPFTTLRDVYSLTAVPDASDGAA